MVGSMKLSTCNPSILFVRRTIHADTCRAWGGKASSARSLMGLMRSGPRYDPKYLRIGALEGPWSTRYFAFEKALKKVS